jgi:hypothetical protein
VPFWKSESRSISGDNKKRRQQTRVLGEAT